MGSRFLTIFAVVGLGVLPALPVHAQQTQTPAAQTPTTNVDKLPISLDRIREQLAREPVFSENLLHALHDVPVFRVETRSDVVFKPDPNYWKDNDVGAYVRPTVNRWDYDLQKMMNPNLPNGYGPGGGVDVLPAIQSLVAGVRNGFRNQSAAATRKQIQEELREINEQRRAAGLPPLEEIQAAPPTRQP